MKKCIKALFFSYRLENIQQGGHKMKILCFPSGGIMRGLSLFLLFFIVSFSAFAQRLLTLDQAVEEALNNSPDIIQARLSLEQSRENLIAQRASLKSNFRLNLQPIQFTRDRRYNEDIGKWIDVQITVTAGTFSIEQPIIWTD